MEYILSVIKELEASPYHKIKIDIGLSYSAPHSKLWLDKDPNLLVIGFEPNPDSVDSITGKNIIPWHPGHGVPLDLHYINDRFFLVPVALSNVESETTMDFYKTQQDVGTSSLYRPTDANIGPIKDVIKVPVLSLKMFFDNFPWNKYEYIEYIKIDAQGSDYNILLGAGEYLKDRVVYITAEPESASYEGCNMNTSNNITQYLNTQGFIQIDHPDTVDPTFVNSKFLHLKDLISIKQIG